MDQTIPRARCRTCSRGLSFADWERGAETCSSCASDGRRAPRASAPPGRDDSWDYRRHEHMLDEIPDELIDELVKVLEEEDARRRAGVMSAEPGPAAGRTSLLREVVDEVGIGRSQREAMWAAWGFTIGFGANLAMAKYAQVSGGGSFSDFLLPMLIGGLAAGSACAAVGWGLAKLRERPQDGRRA